MAILSLVADELEPKGRPHRDEVEASSSQPASLSARSRRTEASPRRARLKAVRTAAAIAFATGGAQVAITDRTKAALAKLYAEVEMVGGEVISMRRDVAVPEVIQAAAAETVKRFHRLECAFKQRASNFSSKARWQWASPSSPNTLNL